MKANLRTRTLISGNKFLIKDGVPVDDYKIPDTPVTKELLETLYEQYKHSIPTDNRKRLFKALPVEELSDTDLITGSPRRDAYRELTCTILIGVINKSLTWESLVGKEHINHWFWQSEKDPDFVILKKWIC